MKNMIWALFSVENNYDQPENNLVAWWSDKPSFDELANGLGWGGFPCRTDEATLYVVNLWQGANTQRESGGTRYRLVCLGEGLVK